MEQKPDWANIDDEEDEDQYDEQEQQDEKQEQVEGKQESQGDTKPTYESRPPGYGRGRGQRGGSRGGRGGRGGRGTRGGGHGEQRERRDRPQGPKASQPKDEMTNVIKGSNERTILINLFNVDYNAKEEDIRNIYKDVKINEVIEIKAGIFLLDLDKEEALNIVEIGAKELNGRPFFMKIGFSNKKQNPDEQWHHVNAANHRHHVGHREDRPRRGGGDRPYNRREQNDQDFGGFNQQRKPYNKDRPPRDYTNKEPITIDPDNKFFKGHDLTASEFNIKFTKSTSSTKKEDETTESTQPKVSKPNPFGGAVARDETEYLKRKKEEEKSQVKDLQEHFEEKKEELQKEKEPKTLHTPVNSPNTEFVEGGEKGEAQKSKPKTQEARGPPGFSGKGQKKAGLEKQETKKKPVEQPKVVEKPKIKTANKANVFDLLSNE